MSFDINANYDGGFHQYLMDLAYKRWNTEGDLKGVIYETFVRSLDDRQQRAVVLGNLEQQVCNGGWGLWYGNGYHRVAHETLEVLGDMIDKGYRLADRVIPMIEAILQAEAEIKSGAYGAYDKGGQHYAGYRSEEADEDQGYDPYEEQCEFENKILGFCDANDDLYYEFNEAFLIQCEVYLRRLSEIEVPVEFLETHREALQRDALTPEKVEIQNPAPRKPKVRLTGESGNIFSIMGCVERALRKAGASTEALREYREQSMSGDYNNALRVAMDWVEVS